MTIFHLRLLDLTLPLLPTRIKRPPRPSIWTYAFDPIDHYDDDDAF